MKGEEKKRMHEIFQVFDIIDRKQQHYKDFSNQMEREIRPRRHENKNITKAWELLYKYNYYLYTKYNKEHETINRRLHNCYEKGNIPAVKKDVLRFVKKIDFKMSRIENKIHLILGRQKVIDDKKQSERFKKDQEEWRKKNDEWHKCASGGRT